MSQVLAANNAQSTLANSISNVATTANLQAGSGTLFPSPGAGQYFCMTFTDAVTGLLHEIVHVTNVSGDTITMVRAQEGTTGLNWTANDLASNLWTAGQFAILVQEADAQAQTFNFAVDTGVLNAYIVGFTPPVSVAPGAGMPIRFTTTNANTSASTINAGWGVVSIVRRDGSPLAGNEIVSGFNELFWDGTHAVYDKLAPATNAEVTGGTDTESGVTPAQLASTSFAPSGSMTATGAITAPAGWLLCTGAAVSRTTFANLLAAITAAATVTMTIATPCVVTWNAHGLKLGSPISFETTGALPTGINSATNYFVLNPTTNTFNVGTFTGSLSNVCTAASFAAGNVTYTMTSAHGLSPGSLVVMAGFSPVGYNGVYTCIAGTTGSTIVVTRSDPGSVVTEGSLTAQIAAVASSGSQSGIQTCRFNPYGCGDGSTTFNLPDARGRVLAGADAMGGTAANVIGANYSLNGFITAALGNVAGEQGHFGTVPELVAHTHGMNSVSGSNAMSQGGPVQGSGASAPTGSTGLSNLSNVTQPTLLVNVIIKT